MVGWHLALEDGRGGLGTPYGIWISCSCVSAYLHGIFCLLYFIAFRPNIGIQMLQANNAETTYMTLLQAFIGSNNCLWSRQYRDIIMLVFSGIEKQHDLWFLPFSQTIRSIHVYVYLVWINFTIVEFLKTVNLDVSCNTKMFKLIVLLKEILVCSILNKAIFLNLWQLHTHFWHI